jgi:hypothetical protein
MNTIAPAKSLSQDLMQMKLYFIGTSCSTLCT